MGTMVMSGARGVEDLFEEAMARELYEEDRFERGISKKNYKKCTSYMPNESNAYNNGRKAVAACKQTEGCAAVEKSKVACNDGYCYSLCSDAELAKSRVHVTMVMSGARGVEDLFEEAMARELYEEDRFERGI